jgi:hypothetical protein
VLWIRSRKDPELFLPDPRVELDWNNRSDRLQDPKLDNTGNRSTKIIKQVSNVLVF